MWLLVFKSAHNFLISNPIFINLLSTHPICRELLFGDSSPLKLWAPTCTCSIRDGHPLKLFGLPWHPANSLSSSPEKVARLRGLFRHISNLNKGCGKIMQSTGLVWIYVSSSTFRLCTVPLSWEAKEEENSASVKSLGGGLGDTDFE